MSISMIDPSGKPIAIWSLFWKTFGSSNQLLAALALVGVTVWLQRTSAHPKAWLATFIPSVFMCIMSIWALISTFLSYTFVNGAFTIPVGTNMVVPGLCLLYLVLAIWVIIECAPTIVRHARWTAGRIMHPDAGPEKIHFDN